MQKTISIIVKGAAKEIKESLYKELLSMLQPLNLEHYLGSTLRTP